jgi:hypothetical protein
VPNRTPAGEVAQLAQRRVRRVDLGLVADAVGRGADAADRRIVQVTRQRLKPPFGHNRVVVEQHEYVAARHGQGLVVRRRKAAVVFVADHAHVRVQLRQFAEVIRRRVSRGIVDDDDLVIRRVRVNQHCVKAQSREHEVVVRDDDDGRSRRPGFYAWDRRRHHRPRGRLAQRRRIARDHAHIERVRQFD